jgi:hypothetical protein
LICIPAAAPQHFPQFGVHYTNRNFPGNPQKEIRGVNFQGVKKFVIGPLFLI